MTIQPNIQFFTLRSIKAVLCMLVMSSIAFTAVAQPAHNSEAPTDDAATVSELAEMLTSPDAEERNHAFQRVTDMAYRQPKIDLSPTVPVLVDIYKNDPEKKYRLGAVSALYAIGSEAGMQQVRQRVLQEPSLHVQYVSLSALLDHYGPEAFGQDEEAVALAKNVLARKQEAKRLAQQVQQADPIAAKQR